MIKESYDFIGESSSLNVTNLPILVTIASVVAEIFLNCHMTSQEHMIKLKTPLSYVSILQSLVVIGMVVVTM